MLKRLCGIFIFACFILNINPAFALQSQQGKIEGTNLVWEYDDQDDRLTISGTGTLPELEPFLDIGIHNSMKSVVIQNGVTNIGDKAFFECAQLTQITLPDTLKGIGKQAFYGCPELLNVVIPGSVEEIGDFAFSNCYRLEKITLQPGLKVIGEGAFDDCEKLESITIPYGVTTIKPRAFQNCDGMTRITIGDSVNEIGNLAFSNCTKLESIKLPENLKKLENDIFFGCSNLSSISIPDGLTVIDDDAFDSCPKLSQINISSNNPAFTLENGVLYNKNKTELIFCTKNLTGNFTILNSVKKIHSYAFSSCRKLTNISIPFGVEEIGAGAFGYCSGLSTISIPGSVTKIPDYAFFSCNSLTSISLPASITEIGAAAFCNCSSLNQITIPEKVTAILDYTFMYCQSLTQITIPYNVTYIGVAVLADCDNLQKITILGNVDKIGASAFCECDRLVSITIPKSVKSIEYRAFYNSNNLSDVYYSGVDDEWNKIKINDNGNDVLYNAAIHFGETDPNIPSGATHKVSDTPVFSENDIFGGKSITISKPPEGKETFFSIDKGDVMKYTESINIYQNSQICAYNASPNDMIRMLKYYDVKLEKTSTPVSNKPSGEVPNGTGISLQSYNDGRDTVIYYTTNGEEPDMTKNLYTKPIPVNGPVTIKAVAYAMGRAVSDTLVLNFTVKAESELDITSEELIIGNRISLKSSMSNYKIYYTTDGSDPYTSSTVLVYDKPFVVFGSQTTIKAYVTDGSNSVMREYLVNRESKPIYKLDKDSGDTTEQLYACDFVKNIARKAKNEKAN